MKQPSKKEREREKREEHKVRRRQKKDLSDLNRKSASLTEKPRILIVCEGENTEPSYFNSFKLKSATVKAVGEGYNTISLVRKAQQLSKDEEYNQVWCVFDKDDFSNSDFNEAIWLSQKSGFGVGYSNQAFEYWLILHLNDHQGGALHRRVNNAMINEVINQFGISYDGDGNKLISDDFFDYLFAVDDQTGQRRVDLAIRRAKRNYNRFEHRSPAEEESSTTVFRLVDELLKYM
jgi:hypothetical protein